MVADTAVLFAAYLIADYPYQGMAFFRQNTLAEVTLPAQLPLPNFLTIVLYNGSYTLDSLKDWRLGAIRAPAALAISTALSNFIIYFVWLHTTFSRITLHHRRTHHRADVHRIAAGGGRDNPAPAGWESAQCARYRRR
uniref:hypothetical protein n=1 Tax=Altererythrobacter segetis TaxID=1104773 RepID=UPI001FAFFABA|nr:hypothetical protein [Altererythrobacter segetis]